MQAAPQSTPGSSVNIILRHGCHMYQGVVPVVTVLRPRLITIGLSRNSKKSIPNPGRATRRGLDLDGGARLFFSEN